MSVPAIAVIVFMFACLLAAVAVLYAVAAVVERRAAAEFEAAWIDPRTVEARREHFAVFGN